MLKPYVVRTIVLSRADACLSRRDCVFDLRWSADQAEYRRPAAERAPPATTPRQLAFAPPTDRRWEATDSRRGRADFG